MKLHWTVKFNRVRNQRKGNRLDLRWDPDLDWSLENLC